MDNVENLEELSEDELMEHAYDCLDGALDAYSVAKASPTPARVHDMRKTVEKAVEYLEEAEERKAETTPPSSESGDIDQNPFSDES